MSDGRGRAPGEKTGGRQKGTKNKATIEHENMISRAMGKLDRPLGKEVLAEIMMDFRGMAKDQAEIGVNSRRSTVPSRWCTAGAARQRKRRSRCCAPLLLPRRPLTRPAPRWSSSRPEASS